MKIYFQIMKLFGKRLLIVFILYQLSRLLFLSFDSASFNGIDTKLLYSGIIYDLSAIGFINLAFGLLFLIPLRFIYNATYQKVVKVIFFAVNVLFLATNFVDCEYYKFTGRRSTYDLISARGMENEIAGLIPSFLASFWYIPLLFVLSAYLLWKSLSSLTVAAPSEKLSGKVLPKQVVFILALGTLLIMGCGGLQAKPLRIVDAVEYTKLGNSALVLNTPYSIIKTIVRKETLLDTQLYSEKELASIFNPEFRCKPQEPFVKENVVIVSLESFGDENVQKGYTPFLDSLITKSYFFKNGFANGKVSIDAVPSIMSSIIPSLMNRPLITSEYSLNKIYSLPKIFKKQGYQNAFFHGAFNGSQNFAQYCNVAWFDAYNGKNQYPNNSDFDGNWGIYDEPFMQFFCDEISTLKQPFFATVSTITSQHPYKIPKKYRKKLPKGTAPIHQSIAYTDLAVRKFFEKAKKQEWYQNTFFVLTADHTSIWGKGGYKTNVGKFQIPIFFLDTANPNLRGLSNMNFQQTEILPSLMDYLNIEEQVVTFGKSFKTEGNFVVNYVDNIYNYINDDYYLAYDGHKAVGLYNFKKDPFLKNNLMQTVPKISAKMERFIGAYIQSFNGRQIRNELTIE